MPVRYRVTEAKARFAQLLRIVESGKTVVITRHGRVVAHVVPAQEAECEDYAQAVARFQRRRKEWEPIGMSVDKMIQARHEGHRW